MTCFIVLGTPRSGTSLVAGVLHHLGVRMGEYLGKERDGITDRWDYGEANEWNPKGFFEDSAFVNLLFEVYGADFPTSPAPLPAPVLARLEALIARRHASALAVGAHWGIKTVNLGYCLPQFVAIAARLGIAVRMIRVSRESGDSAASWAARRECSAGEATRAIAAVSDGLVRSLRGINAAAILNVEFASLVGTGTERHAEVGRIAAFCDVPLTSAALDFPDPSLRRF